MARKINVEDRLLGMMAVEKRFISEKQLTECLNTIEFTHPDKTLESVFLDKEYLTKPQIERLRQQLQASIEIQTKQKERTQKIFGEIALEQNMIDQSQLEKGLAHQEKYLERGLKVQIGQVLSKLSFLTVAQVGRLLESQLKKVLYCKHCKISKIVYDYNSSQIHQCEKCKLDLIEGAAKKQEKKPKQVAHEDLEDDADIGNLDILEL
ncbi:MAG: hypothetical protein HUU50_12165 [Candidatus Brocadiae bacterium]|nr:hypothetical protein [Candidatus Brocadiia bacterium]